MVVSKSIHNQMLRVRETKSFVMTSYVIYAAARMGIFPGINTVGILGEAPRTKEVVGAL